jgi:hypothetical protein
MILETPWQTFPLSSLREDGNQIEVTDLPMNLNVTILEDMIINATLSLLTLGNWTTVVSANVMTYDTVYNFDRKAFLILPYGIALSLSLIFIYIGVTALVSNGVPADNGGFLQVACTTTGNETFEQAAAGGCLGGDKNFGSELKELVLQYGELQGGVVRRAGFGPPESVQRLVKGEQYGCELGKLRDLE